MCCPNVWNDGYSFGNEVVVKIGVFCCPEMNAEIHVSILCDLESIVFLYAVLSLFYCFCLHALLFHAVLVRRDTLLVIIHYNISIFQFTISFLI